VEVIKVDKPFLHYKMNKNIEDLNSLVIIINHLGPSNFLFITSIPSLKNPLNTIPFFSPKKIK